MKESNPSHSKNSMSPKTSAHGGTERLSSQERVAVAERLLKDATVSKIYVNDIVQCVADMVCEMDEKDRFGFAKQIYAFINDSQHYEGRETFRVFGDTLLGCLNENEH